MIELSLLELALWLLLAGAAGAGGFGWWAERASRKRLTLELARWNDWMREYLGGGEIQQVQVPSLAGNVDVPPVEGEIPSDEADRIIQERKPGWKKEGFSKEEIAAAEEQIRQAMR